MARRDSTPRSRPLLALMALLATACGQAPPALRVDGIRYEERDLLGLSTDRRELLGDLAALGLAVADSTLDAVAEPWVTSRQRDRLWQLWQAERALDSAGVGDDVLRARYLTEPRYELTVRHLLILSPRYETDATRAQARAKAERALERIRNGEDFPEVAADVSEEPGAEGRQGLLTPGREGSWVDEFWNAAMALEPGEISDVVETQYGFHVLRLEDRQVVPFEEARTGVELEVAGMLTTLDTDATHAPEPDGLTLDDEALAALPTPEAPDTLTVARWAGGTLTLDTLRAALAAMERPRRMRALSGSAADGATLVKEIAGAVAMARQATAGGLTASEGWTEEMRRQWRDRANGWATLLGFDPRLSHEGVREAALAALGASGQNATGARDEVRRVASGLLERAYRIETPPSERP